MNAEIITIGTELMLGDTVDTHSSFLSRECRQLGISVLYHTSVDDDYTRLLSLFQMVSARSQLVIICGGLGPTMDDITKEVLADFLGIALVPDLSLVTKLEDHFKDHQSIPPGNYKQTYVFPQGVVFPNHHGTAPGLAISVNETTYILLPGPPKELIPLFQKNIRPFLSHLFPEKESIVYRELSFFGISESILEDKIKDLIKQADNPILATYLYETGVLLRITGKGEQVKMMRRIEQLKREILQRVGEYCYSEQKEKLEEVVVHRLKAKNQTLGCVEDCTGGLLTHLLSKVSGSETTLQGGWITHSHQAKVRHQLVSAEQLANYGAVHAKTTRFMAEQALGQLETDFALSITGVTEPFEKAKPVGTIYIGLAEREKPTHVYQLSLRGTRKRIQQSAARHALFILQQRLRKGEATS